MRTNEYLKLQTKHNEEFNNFPIMFAFTDKSFEEGLVKLGLKKSDTDKVISIGYGGFIRKADKEAYLEMTIRQANERKQAIEDDKTGDGYIYQMFLTELNNHEYGYTYDYEDTLNSLNLTIEEINANPVMKKAFEKARNKFN